MVSATSEARHCEEQWRAKRWLKRRSVTDLYQILSMEMAQAIADQLRDKPASNFGLPTGASPLGGYHLLARWSNEKKIDWSKARCFALDDYLEAEERETFAYYLEENLYQYTNLPKENKFNPRHNDNYDDVIAKAGGLDLTVLGLGTNGHIAFNEPGTPRNSWTHCTWLAESTRMANQTYFGPHEDVPRRAVTMGIETILSSKRIILIVSGKGKQETLEKALLGTTNVQVPASFLSLHPHVTVLSDFEY
jgi:glucosamine-6-phosphate deaminase